MKRGLLVIALGVAFLILITWLGTIVTSIIPHRATAAVQTTSAGPYDVTLQVNPNPPPITQPATLTLKVLLHSSNQPVSNVHVILESNMETMDMGTDREEAKAEGDGMYVAHVQFSMSGSWAIQVEISLPGKQTTIASFKVSTQ